MPNVATGIVLDLAPGVAFKNCDVASPRNGPLGGTSINGYHFYGPLISHWTILLITYSLLRAGP